MSSRKPAIKVVTHTSKVHENKASKSVSKFVNASQTPMKSLNKMTNKCEMCSSNHILGCFKFNQLNLADKLNFVCEQFCVITAYVKAILAETAHLNTDALSLDVEESITSCFTGIGKQQKGW